MAARFNMWPVVLLVGVLLVVVCAGWAVLVQGLVPDVCSEASEVPTNAGPTQCPYRTP